MKEKVFIDPTAVSPRELSGSEMSSFSGGAAPIAVVIWVCSCGEPLGILTAGAIITIME